MESCNSVTNGNAEERVEAATRVAEDVAWAKGVDPLEFGPLFDEVDTDALNNLLARSSGEIAVTFEYEGYRVTVGSDGRVDLK